MFFLANIYLSQNKCFDCSDSAMYMVQMDDMVSTKYVDSDFTSADHRSDLFENNLYFPADVCRYLRHEFVYK